MKSVDKGKKCDRMVPVNVLTELRNAGGQKREGTVRALGAAVFQAAPERSVTSGTPHPRYRMTKRSLRGQLGWYREADASPLCRGGAFFCGRR